MHECPANGAKCHSCGKMGHYQRVCLAGKAVHGIEEEESESFFLGSVSSDADPWTVDICIMDKDVTFKLDSGADVTVVSQNVLNNIFSGTQQPVLQKAEKLLYGPG